MISRPVLGLAALFAHPLFAEEVGQEYFSSLRELESRTVVLIGEVHDNPRHHELQAEALIALGPSAVVFEMLDEGDAAVASEAFDSVEEMAVVLEWDASGWPAFEMYAPVFEATRPFGAVDHPQSENLDGATGAMMTPSVGARIYGGEVTRATAREAFELGAAEVFGPEAARFGLDQPLPEDEQAAREEGQQASHCGMLPEELLPGFVEAQRLRDARLAQVILQSLEDTGGPIAVITGNGHARLDWGVPAVLRRAAPDLTVISIGQLEQPEQAAPYHVWLVSEAPQRDDPCAGFAN